MELMIMDLNSRDYGQKQSAPSESCLCQVVCHSKGKLIHMEQSLDGAEKLTWKICTFLWHSLQGSWSSTGQHDVFS